jgi:hypothetical protein
MFDHTSGIVFAPFITHLSIISEYYDRLLEYLSGENLEDKELSRYVETAQAQAAITVVFTTIVIESFIHNYAARKLGENFAKKHVEKMALLTKWLIIPKLVTGKDIPSDHRGLELLSKLVTARNMLVHLKGKNIPWDSVPDDLSNLRGSYRELISAGLTAFECMGLLGKALCDLDPEEKIGRLFAKMLELPKYTLTTVKQPEQPG